MARLRWILPAAFGLAAGLASGTLLVAVVKGRAAIEAQAAPLPHLVKPLTGLRLPEAGGVPVVLRPVVEGKDIDAVLERREAGSAPVRQ